MIMPFLERISLEKQGEFADLCRMEREKYKKMLDAVGRVSLALAGCGVSYAVFKTVRPYVSTTVDIDIIIFGNGNDYDLAKKAMAYSKYAIIGTGPMTITYQDPETLIGIDLYRDVAVSAICYFDKDMLLEFIEDATLPNGVRIKTLSPEADLTAIIAHSVIKEQMYTLSEYYSFIHYLKRINVVELLQISKRNNLTNAMRTHATITGLLYQQAHGTIPKELDEIMVGLGTNSFETSLLAKDDYATPHKYQVLTVLRSLLEILKGKKCKKSVLTQIHNVFEPDLSRRFLKELIGHVRRETY
jgi:hypothetical protein